MLAFVLRRLGSLVLALFLGSVAIFSLVRIVPGDPARLMLKNPTPEKIAEIRQRLALDRPLPVNTSFLSSACLVVAVSANPL